jgi:hypothetical protein
MVPETFIGEILLNNSVRHAGDFGTRRYLTRESVHVLSRNNAEELQGHLVTVK